MSKFEINCITRKLIRAWKYFFSLLSGKQVALVFINHGKLEEIPDVTIIGQNMFKFKEIVAGKLKIAEVAEGKNLELVKKGHPELLTSLESRAIHVL